LKKRAGWVHALVMAKSRSHRKGVAMDHKQDGGQLYLCPMHRDVRQPNAGTCPKCGMDLLPEGTRFGMLRHIRKNPLMVITMVAVMIAVMVAIMHL